MRPKCISAKIVMDSLGRFKLTGEVYVLIDRSQITYTKQFIRIPRIDRHPAIHDLIMK